VRTRLLICVSIPKLIPSNMRNASYFSYVPVHRDVNNCRYDLRVAYIIASEFWCGQFIFSATDSWFPRDIKISNWLYEWRNVFPSEWQINGTYYNISLWMLLYIPIYYTCIDDCFSGIKIFVVRVRSDYHGKDESVYQRRSQIAFRMDDLFTVHLSNALYKSALWGLRPSLRAPHIKTTFWYIFYTLNSQCNDEILWTILFVPYTRINVYLWINSAITMLIGVSKNDTISFYAHRENI